MLHGYLPLTDVEVTVWRRRQAAPSRFRASCRSRCATTTQKTDLHFPLRGAWWAIQGADWSDRHKQEVFSQPYALDFVKLGTDNRFFSGDGLQVTDHYSWDQPVYATAGGKVAYVIYDLPDLLPGAPPDPAHVSGRPAPLSGATRWR